MSCRQLSFLKIAHHARLVMYQVERTVSVMSGLILALVRIWCSGVSSTIGVACVMLLRVIFIVVVWDG